MGVPERVAYLEGQVTEVSKSFENLQSRLAAFEERVDRRFGVVETRLAALEDRVDRRFEGVDRRFDALDSKISRLFTWIVGLFIMTMTAIVGTFLAR